MKSKYYSVRRIPVVDHPGAAAFPATRQRPTQLAESTCAGNQDAGTGSKRQEPLEAAVGLVREFGRDLPGESWRLYQFQLILYATDVCTSMAPSGAALRGSPGVMQESLVLVPGGHHHSHAPGTTVTPPSQSPPRISRHSAAPMHKGGGHCAPRAHTGDCRHVGGSGGRCLRAGRARAEWCVERSR